MKAAVLGIGTELVDGQIVNKNAAWISERLKQLGLTTALHLVVPDDKKLMLEAMDFCASYGDLLFLTGGLGPTTDDFTRDIVSEWSDKPLIFDEGSWQHIKDRLEQRGYVVKDVQRQQCFYPQGATVLKNMEGTANGFSLEAKDKKLFVLPGPPREVEAVWNSSIHQWLVDNTTHIDPYVTRHWDTMGVGESDVALIVEDVLKGVEVEKGYRVHLPYVEVKMSFFKSQEKQFEPYIEKITQALGHCLITRDQEDVPLMLAKALAPFNSLSVQDSVTGQFLMNRLIPVLRDHMTNKQWSFSNNVIDDHAQVRLMLQPKDEHSCVVSIEKGNQRFADILDSPYKQMPMRERRAQYFAEVAMIFWLRHL